MNDIKTLFEFIESPAPPVITNSAVVKMFVNYLPVNMEGRADDNTPFRHKFFPNHNTASFVSIELEKYCPGDYCEWINALFCQALYHNGQFKDIISYEDVQRVVSEMNGTFSFFATNLYIYYIRASRGIQIDNANKEEYRRYLTSSEWRSKTAAKQKDGNWNNPSWEMYSHWVKFCACGANDYDIKDVYTEITTREPRIDLAGNTDILPDSWNQYGAWRSGQIDYSFISPQNLNSSYSVLYPTPYCPGIPYTNYYGEEFIRNTPWYKSSSGSCFTENTMVVMKDKSLKSIKDIKTGDEVLSINGSRKVAFVAKPFRRKRNIYSINGCRAGMTCTHPVLKADFESFSLMFIDPWIATAHIPPFKAFCAGKLETGSKIQAYKQGEFVPVKVERIHEYVSDKMEEIIYDLILVPEGSRFDTYIVGDEDLQFVVCSEIVPMSFFPSSTIVFLNIIRSCAPALQQFAEMIGRVDFQQQLTAIVRLEGLQLLIEAINKTNALKKGGDINTSLKMRTDKLLINYFNQTNAMELFCLSDGEYDYVTGIAVDVFAASFTEYLPGIIEMGWRNMESCGENYDFIAVSVYNISVVEPHMMAAEERCELILGDGRSQQLICQTANKRIHQSPYLRTFFSCVYFAKLDKNLLQFIARCGSEKWEGRLNIPEKQENFCNFMTTILCDEAGKEAAHISLDIRRISLQDKEEESSAAVNWGDRDIYSFAIKFGIEAGKLISENKTICNTYRHITK